MEGSRWTSTWYLWHLSLQYCTNNCGADNNTTIRVLGREYILPKFSLAVCTDWWYLDSWTTFNYQTLESHQKVTKPISNASNKKLGTVVWTWKTYDWISEIRSDPILNINTFFLAKHFHTVLYDIHVGVRYRQIQHSTIQYENFRQKKAQTGEEGNISTRLRRGKRFPNSKLNFLVNMNRLHNY